ncbi:MAG: alpha/beta hydrolase, partial [Candidatus Moranbacteria bacterium]|nr:alpha/beta hydrolase [Candidatus Moranbacteria bacterium]
MKTLLFFLLFVLSCLLLQSAEVTIIVTSLPANTPPGDNVYIAGNFNGWNPGNPDFILFPNNAGMPEIVLTGSGTIEFKFTRGDWQKVEGNETGGYLPNRTFTYGIADTLEVVILSWEDLGGPGSTAAENVIIMDDSFYMPQLNRYRRIWLYLPPDYENSGKSYPVLYMHDGQDLFDLYTSFAGEWEVDETLNALFDDGKEVPIVVGID